MKAYLETSFKKGFLLTEEGLIKLDDIVRKRLFPAEPSKTLKYKVFRVDGMLLEFDVPAEVVSEENSSRNAISRLEVSYAGDSKFQLVFDPKKEVELEIESDDRDLAYLLFSDIKEYLNSEILKFRSSSFESLFDSKLVMPLFMMVFFVATIYMTVSGNHDEDLAKAIASDSVIDKLNYMIETRQQLSVGRMLYPMLGMMVIFFGVIFSGSFFDKIFPRNVFCWGKAATAHNNLLKTREKWLWGVAIAFVISVLATFVTDGFKRFVS
ncbi:hypothetical protein NJF44_15785 [Pseudomonas guariconensis]|uniref:hypothetical protein n=1 Tax=Pseudomonas TaxID=286 RepID=UPI0020972A05|nr:MULTISPECIES: hypothetical protein [Pseudomonas]MCO7516400.1 hypothetical protein [Pseudomonas putida]MCO7606700.1 hypothetical protein [Pseudomonas guariconensis]